ncbi:metal-binding protein [Halobellus sp. Atlit-31R]|nr:metal-binding protein [Halobellus sp. Atlit-31R]
MKKQELIHLHGLLAEVHTQVEAWEDEEVSLEAYNELGVRPTSIHKSKTDHKAAVFKLVKGITASLDDVEQERVAATAD